MTGRELRDEEALDAEERHGAELDLRDLDDPEVDAALLQRLGLPRAGDPERRLLVEERVLRLAVVDARVDEALGVPAVDQRRVPEERRVRDAELVRVQRAVLRDAEDVAAETREQRIHVVRVTVRTLRDGKCDPAAALLLEGQRLRLELLPRLGNLDEAGVDDQTDVLELRRHAVFLAAVRHRGEGISRELLLDRLRREDRDDRAVRGERARPVVRADDHVRRVAGGDVLEIVLDLPEVLYDHGDVHAAGLAPRARDLVDRRLAVAVGPDHDLARLRARMRRRCRTATDQGQRRCEDDREQDGEAPSYLHRFLLLFQSRLTDGRRRLAMKHVLPP